MSTREQAMQAAVAAAQAGGEGLGPGTAPEPSRAAQAAIAGAMPGGGVNQRDRLVGTLQRSRNPVEIAATAAKHFGAGLITGAALDPLDALTDIATLIPGEAFDMADDFIDRAKSGLLNAAEVHAVDAGMEEDELTAWYMLGNVFGMFAPIGGAQLTANVMLNRGLMIDDLAEFAIKQGLSPGRAKAKVAGRYALFGDPVTDTVGAGIYAAILSPVEVDQSRTEQIARDMVVAGSLGIVFRGLGKAFLGWRENRAITAGVKGQAIGDLARGGTPEGIQFRETLDLKGELSREAISEMNYQNYLGMSPKSQQLLNLDFNEVVADHAIRKFHATQGETVISSVLQYNNSNPLAYVEEIEPLLQRMREANPGIIYRTLKNGATDDLMLVGSTQSLTRQMISDFKTHGFMEGQNVYHVTGRTGRFVGRKGDDVTVEFPGLKRQKKWNINDVQPGPAGVEKLVPIDEVTGGIVKSAMAFIEATETKIAMGNPQPIANEVMAALRRGGQQLDNSGRIVTAGKGGAVTQPNALGYLNSYAPDDVQAMQQMDEQIQTFQTLKAAALEAENAVGVQQLDQKIGELRQGLEERLVFSADRVVREMQKTGFEYSSLNSTAEQFGLDLQIKAALATQGITPNDPRYAALEGMIHSTRDEQMWAQSPEILSIMNKVHDYQDELDEILGFGIGEISEAKGFSYFAHPDGIHHTIIDSLTGKDFQFNDPEKLRQALRGFIREGGDMSSLDVPLRANGLTGASVKTKTDGNIYNATDMTPEGMGLLPTDTWITQSRNMMIEAQSVSGRPVFDIFDDIAGNSRQANIQNKPFEDRLEIIFDGITPSQQGELTAFNRMLGTREDLRLLNAADEVRLAEERWGRGSRLAKVVKEQRQWYDDLFVETGLGDDMYEKFYMQRLQPEGALVGNAREAIEFAPELNIPEWNPMFTMARRGDGNLIEERTKEVARNYSRSMFMWKNTEQAREGMRRELNMRGTDMSPEWWLKNKEVIEGKGGSKDSFIWTPEMRKFIWGHTELVTATRRTDKTGPGFLRRLFGKVMGVEIPDEAVRDLASLYRSTKTASALGARPMSVVRDGLQTTFFAYMRFGREGFAKGQLALLDSDEFFRVSRIIGLDPEGFRVKNESFLEAMSDKGIVPDGSIRGSLIAGLYNHAGLRGSELARKVSRASLSFYDAGDTAGRISAAVQQEVITRTQWNLLKAGKIDRATFMRKGLRTHGQVVRDRFMQMTDAGDPEGAIGFLMRQTSDEVMIDYTKANTNMWMQTTAGKTFGMFGRYPIGVVNSANRVFKSMTPLERFQAGARAGAVMAGLSLISRELNVDMQSYNSYNVLYSGGPAVEDAINVKNIIDAPNADARMTGIKRLGLGMSGLMLPGQIAYGDIQNARAARTPQEMATRIFFGRNRRFPIPLNYDLDFVQGRNVPQLPEGFLDAYSRPGYRTSAPRVGFAELEGLRTELGFTQPGIGR